MSTLTEDTDESDQHFLSGLVSSWHGSSDDCDDQLRNCHSRRTVKKKWTSSELVDRPHSGDGSTNVDDIRGDRDHEGVRYAAVLEELGALSSNGG